MCIFGLIGKIDNSFHSDILWFDLSSDKLTLNVTKFQQHRSTFKFYLLAATVTKTMSSFLIEMIQ